MEQIDLITSGGILPGGGGGRVLTNVGMKGTRVWITSLLVFRNQNNRES